VALQAVRIHATHPTVEDHSLPDLTPWLEIVPDETLFDDLVVPDASGYYSWNRHAVPRRGPRPWACVCTDEQVVGHNAVALRHYVFDIYVKIWKSCGISFEK
jgi:hypothetical protein